MTLNTGFALCCLCRSQTRLLSGWRPLRTSGWKAPRSQKSALTLTSASTLTHCSRLSCSLTSARAKVTMLSIKNAVHLWRFNCVETIFWKKLYHAFAYSLQGNICAPEKVFKKCHWLIFSWGSLKTEIQMYHKYIFTCFKMQSLSFLFFFLIRQYCDSM